MTWNYRVLEFVDPSTEEPWKAIHEVYYDEAGVPWGYAEEPARAMSTDPDGSVADLAWVLDRMRDALDRPTLTERDFPAPTPTDKHAGEIAA